MFALRKNYVLDENQQPIAVQIPIGDFERLEAILEDYGLAQLMDELPEADRERLSQAEGGLTETAHLLQSPANVAHLVKSIEQFKQGQAKERGLLDE
jgi:PHD/YefM family antitoxin component YafN of YafNO toxin-antitoxin module